MRQNVYIYPLYIKQGREEVAAGSKQTTHRMFNLIFQDYEGPCEQPITNAESKLCGLIKSSAAVLPLTANCRVNTPCSIVYFTFSNS